MSPLFPRETHSHTGQEHAGCSSVGTRWASSLQALYSPCSNPKLTHVINTALISSISSAAVAVPPPKDPHTHHSAVHQICRFQHSQYPIALRCSSVPIHLPARQAVAWLPVASQLDGRVFGEELVDVLHRNLAHIYINRALWGGGRRRGVRSHAVPAWPCPILRTKKRWLLLSQDTGDN